MEAASDCPGEATDALWQLRLLGGFELSDGRRRITRLPSRAAVTLLARLALWPDRAHAREALVELLWPGVALDAGRHRLRQILSSLRSLLEPPQREGFEVFEVDRHAIRLRAGAISCDALRFAQACQRGWHPLARELNAGELLPGHCDDWVLDERRRLEVMAERLPAAPQGGTPPAATSSALTPAPATSADAPAPAPLAATASVLPHYLSRLVGADRQASRLHAEVLHHRLVKVLGPGGIGKTRLAVEVAQALSRSAGQLLWASSASGLPPGGEAFDLCHRFPHSRCKLKSSAASKPSSPSPTVSKSA